jgi:5-formyltetrahydrofolate cyclo-ligase
MKKKLRQHIRQVLERLPPAAKAAKSELAQRALAALPEFAAARAVMIYLPMVEEVDTAHIARQAWSAGKRVLAPRVDMATRTMEAIEIHSLSDGLAAGPYGILHPTSGEPWPPDKIDLIVVPAMAFCRRGGRLGRGAGFYDRFLLRARTGAQPLACGLAFDEQVLETLPMFEHDQWLDMVVSDKEVLDLRKSGD